MRKDLYQKRIASIVEYATHKKCRSQQLLSYFGDVEATRCGVCDVCAERNKLELSTYEFDLVLKEVKEVIKSKAISVEGLVDSVDQHNDKVIKVVQWLLDNEKIVKDSNFLLHWK